MDIRTGGPLRRNESEFMRVELLLGLPLPSTVPSSSSSAFHRGSAAASNSIPPTDSLLLRFILVSKTKLLFAVCIHLASLVSVLTRAAGCCTAGSVVEMDRDQPAMKKRLGGNLNGHPDVPALICPPFKNADAPLYNGGSGARYNTVQGHTQTVRSALLFSHCRLICNAKAWYRVVGMLLPVSSPSDSCRCVNATRVTRCVDRWLSFDNCSLVAGSRREIDRQVHPQPGLPAVEGPAPPSPTKRNVQLLF